MRAGEWHYFSEDGHIYSVDRDAGVLTRQVPVRDIKELPRDLIEALKAAKFTIRVNGEPVSLQVRLGG